MKRATERSADDLVHTAPIEALNEWLKLAGFTLRERPSVYRGRGGAITVRLVWRKREAGIACTFQQTYKIDGA